MSLRPRVITDTDIQTSLVAPVSNRIAAMIGTATWGPVNEVRSVNRLSQFQKRFGTDKAGTDITGIKGADLFFRNGNNLKFVRITDGTDAKAEVTLQNDTTDVLKLEAYYTGTYGNNILVTVQENDSARNVIISDGTTTERYTNAGQGYETNEDIVTAINNSSQLVTASVEGGNETTNLVDATSETQFTGGEDGENVSDSEYETAFDDVLYKESFNVLVIPGKSSDSFQNIITSKVESRASDERKFSRYITGIDVDETLNNISQRTTTSFRTTLVAPNVGDYVNRADNEEYTLDGSYLACAYAGVVVSLPLQVAATHENISIPNVSVNSSSGKRLYSKLEQEELLETSVAPIADINEQLQIIRGVTTIADTSNARYEEVVVDIIDEVTNQVEGYLNTVLGKPNTVSRRELYSQRVDAILEVLKNQGIIESYQPSTVEQGESPDTIDAEIVIKPTYNTNFVNLSITIN